MTEQREGLYFHWSESLQKFDHFVAGLIGVWVAYLVQDFHPEKFTFWPPNPSTLEFSGILLLVASLVAGILKIERNIALIRISYDLVPYHESRQQIQSMAPGTVVYSNDLGKELNADQIRSKEELLTSTIAASEAALKRHSYWCICYNRARNVMGLTGLLSLVVARSTAQYWHG